MNEKATISYDVPATLQKWQSLQARQVQPGDLIGAQTIYTGTLAGCVRQFMMKPISQRPLYDIFTDPQPGLSGSIISGNDIVEIAERDDFPRK